mgnify:CR=1 FL=1
MVFKEREFFGDPADVERKPASELEADVAAALAASGKVDAVDVEVTALNDATVVLSGWVLEEDEIRRCTEAAKAVPGVRGVKSTIAVRAGGSSAPGV